MRKKGCKGYKQQGRVLQTVADVELSGGGGRGWSIVSSKERKGTGPCPPAPAPPPAGAKFSKREREGGGAVVGLCMLGNLCPLGAPYFPLLPSTPPPFPPRLLPRHLILFPATQLFPKAGARKRSAGDNNLTQK